MAEYESIHGTRVRYLTSDPTLDSSTEGQVWYNSTSGANKALVQIKSWSSGGSLATARAQVGGAGTQTAGLCFGGMPGGTATGITEEYNGYNWSPGGTMTTARREVAGLGIQTAALAVGGFISPSAPLQRDETELYNGSTWSEQNDLTTEKRTSGAAGTTSAGLVFGGLVPPNTGTNQTEEWDGTNWSEQNNLNTTRSHLSGAGTQTAALGFGGYIPGSGGTGATEEYNGTNWTTVNSMNTARRSMGPAGTQTAALGFGGSAVPAPPTTFNATEEYDGITWYTSPATLALGRRDLGGCGTHPAALAFAGNGPSPNVASTEEYNSAITQVGAGVWAAGGNLSTARGGFNTSYGIQTASLATGGERTPGGTQETAVEEYGGTSWTSGGAIPTATSGMGGGGTQTAAIMMGGNTPGDNRVKTDLDYNGSSWTANPNMPQDSGATRGFGTQTAAICIGGQQNPGNITHKKTMEWNGSSWSDGGDYPVDNTPNQGIVNVMGFGTQTAALCAGGSHGNGYGSTSKLNSNSYDGSSWTATNALQSIALFGGAFGTQGGGIISGYAPPPVGLTTTQRWDGNGWTTTTSNSVGSQGKAAAGDLSSGLIIGGIFAPSSPNSPNWGEIANTEEWTGDSVIAAAASTLTTS